MDRKSVRLENVPVDNAKRITSNIVSFDNFIGGGLVVGSSILLAGEPGVGKSTFILQLAEQYAKNGYKILYASGEESLSQVRKRADRLKIEHAEIWCFESLNLKELFAEIKKVDPDIIIVDSLQMLHTQDTENQVGSHAKIQSSLLSLMNLMKEMRKTLIVIGHSTKQGKIAGTLTLQHMTDVVLFLTKVGENTRQLASHKNRFGPTKKWIVNMSSKGILDAANTEKVILEHNKLAEVVNRSFLNRIMILGDLKWLYRRAFGKQGLNNIIKYDIIYTLKKNG
jgi:DNA repair protein RadA/Sms